MAVLRANGIEVELLFYKLDSCGDIIYSYRFLYNGNNILNPNNLKSCYIERFTTTEADFENSGVLEFFRGIIEENVESYYESFEPPIIYIDAKGWLEKREYTINKLINLKHVDGSKMFSEEFVYQHSEEFLSKKVEFVFSIGVGYMKDEGSHSKIGLSIQTFISELEIFVAELKREFIEFKNRNIEQHYKLDT